MRLVVGFTLAVAVMFAIGPEMMIKRIQQIQIQGQAETGAEVLDASAGRVGASRSPDDGGASVFGVGLGQFQPSEFQYIPVADQPRGRILTLRTTPIVQLGAEGGILTLALYLAILGVTLASCRKAEKTPGVPDATAALALCFSGRD